MIDNTLLISNGTGDLWQATSGGSTTVTNTKVVTVEVTFESNGKTDTVNLKIIWVN